MKIIEEDFCGMDVNTPLGGEKPAVAISVLNFSVPLTAVAATSAGNYTVVFLGTRQGHLKKVLFKYSFEFIALIIIHSLFEIGPLFSVVLVALVCKI